MNEKIVNKFKSQINCISGFNYPIDGLCIFNKHMNNYILLMLLNITLNIQFMLYT